MKEKTKDFIIMMIIVIISYSIVLFIERYVIYDYAQELVNDLNQMCNDYTFYKGGFSDMDICAKYQDVLNP